MTSPIERIQVECPSCHHQYEDWYRPSVSLAFDNFSDEYLDRCSSAVCPKCKTKVSLHTLLVTKGDKPPRQSIMAARLSAKYREILVWWPEAKSWYRQDPNKPGAWSKLKRDYLLATLAKDISKMLPHGFTSYYLNGVERLMRTKLCARPTKKS